jgi:hypothetical protein
MEQTFIGLIRQNWDDSLNNLRFQVTPPTFIRLIHQNWAGSLRNIMLFIGVIS